MTDNTPSIDDIQARLAARRGQSPQATSRAAHKRSKPAVSAKILATGLSTTAMLGMTAGYAAATHSKQPPTNPTPSTQPAAATNSGLPTDATSQTSGGTPALGPLVPAPVQSRVAGVSPASPSVATPVEPVSPTQTLPSEVNTPGANIAPTPVVTAAPQVIEVPVAPPAPADPGNGGGGWNNQPSSGSN